MARFRSKLGELAVAVLLMEVLLPEPLSFTVMANVADAPFAIFPTLQVIVPTVPTDGAEHAAPCEFNETNVELAGTGSFTTTAAAL